MDNGCVLFTHDLDFGALLAMTHKTGPSVIQVRTRDVMPDTIADLVLSVLQIHKGWLEKGAIISVDESLQRVRVLPVKS
jgi:predicted nuclease of predicted toxin-antitoxin system